MGRKINSNCGSRLWKRVKEGPAWFKVLAEREPGRTGASSVLSGEGAAVNESREC